MSNVDKIGFRSVPFVFELSKCFEVGFHGGVVGDVGVLVEGVFGFLTVLFMVVMEALSLWAFVVCCVLRASLTKAGSIWSRLVDLDIMMLA